jgi:hypothetical protein
MVPIHQSQASFPLMNNGPPPAVTPYHPQYTDLSSESIESPSEAPQAQIASPVEGGMKFVFNTSVPGCFTTIKGDQNLESPPETPQAQMAIYSSGNGWLTGVDFHGKQWHFKVPDEPLYTPAHDTVNLELQMPQPTYLSALSQPVTPTFGQFNPNFMFGHEPPQYKNEPPQYMLSTQAHPDFETMPPLTAPSSVNSIVSPPTPMEPNPERVTPHFTAKMRKFEVLDDPVYDILNECWIHDLKSQSEGDELVPNLSNETERNAKRAGSLARAEVAGTCRESLHASSVAHSARVKVAAAETFPAEVTVERLKPTWTPPASIPEEQESPPIDSDNVDQVPIKLEGGTGMEADDKDEELSKDDNRVFEGSGTEQIDSPYEQGIRTKPRPALDFNNEEYDSVLLSILGNMRQALVEHVMNEFWFIYAQEWTTGTSGNSPMSPNRNQDFRKPEPIAPCQTFQRKRERDDEDQPDDNGDKKRRQQRDRSGPSSHSHRRGRFACPFRKHDCQKYSVYNHRVCVLTSWDTISRVK